MRAVSEKVRPGGGEAEGAFGEGALVPGGGGGG